jgi:phosphoribosylglycinamide formyltransferase-1
MAIAVFVSGTGTNLQAMIDDVDIDIEMVITNRNAKFVSALRRCENAGISWISYLNNMENLEKYTTETFEEKNVELIVLAGFMKLLSPAYVKRWEGKIINIHPSLLPSFKGAHAIEQAFEYGVKYTGVTVHYVDEGMDTGSIIAQQTVKVAKRDTVETLEKKIHKVEHKLYPKVIKDLLK